LKVAKKQVVVVKVRAVFGSSEEGGIVKDALSGREVSRDVFCESNVPLGNRTSRRRKANGILDEVRLVSAAKTGANMGP
jgi:hypothetical protein